MSKLDWGRLCTCYFDSSVFHRMSEYVFRSVRTSHAAGTRSIQTECPRW